MYVLQQRNDKILFILRLGRKCSTIGSLLLGAVSCLSIAMIQSFSTSKYSCAVSSYVCILYMYVVDFVPF